MVAVHAKHEIINRGTVLTGNYIHVIYHNELHDLVSIPALVVLFRVFLLECVLQREIFAVMPTSITAGEPSV